MFFSLGALLSDIARESSQDKTSKSVFSTVHTICCVGATAHNLIALTRSIQRTTGDLSESLSGLNQAIETRATERKAA